MSSTPAFAPAFWRTSLAGLTTAILAVILLAPAAGAMSGTELVEHGAEYDGRSVVYRGEAIGEVMRRGRNAVVNLSDGTYALGVWAPVGAAAAIRRVGRYSVVGDVVEVRGTFHRACAEHGGDLDIHAETLTVVTGGKVTREPLHRGEALLAAILWPIALGLVGWHRYRMARLKTAESDLLEP